MTLSKIQDETTPEPTKTPKKTKTSLGGWELFNPHDIFETKELGVFFHFLNSKNTVGIELLNLSASQFTVAITGLVNKEEEKSTIFFTHLLTKIKRDDKIEMISSIYALPGVGNIIKNRLGETLAVYLDVQKETAQG